MAHMVTEELSFKVNTHEQSPERIEGESQEAIRWKKHPERGSSKYKSQRQKHSARVDRLDYCPRFLTLSLRCVTLRYL